jgi:glutathione S-transferase-like protein
LRRSSAWFAEFAAVTAPLEKTLAEQPYIAGVTSGYADYIVFSMFQYARLGCPDEFLDEGTALRRWRDGLVQAFDGLGDRYQGWLSFTMDYAMAQGAHGLARGLWHFEHCTKLANSLGLDFRWRLEIAHGAGHVDQRIYDQGANVLAGRS